MHARASAQYSVYIGDMEAIAPILSARDRLCRAYIAMHVHCSSIVASIVLHSLASHTLQFDLADCGTFVVPTKVQAGFGTEAFKSVLSRQYRDGWTVCKLDRLTTGMKKTGKKKTGKKACSSPHTIGKQLYSSVSLLAITSCLQSPSIVADTIETMTSTTRSIACTFCHHPFSTHEELSRHMVIHRREERPFKCRICGKAFKQQAHRDAHIRTHTNDRPYACQHCGQLFKQSGHLNRHCLRRHTDRRELPHSCSKCSQKFATKWGQHSRG